ncbi:hypothetical protein [Phenylobacterium sp.]|uniref:TolB family protein n=1 Tax=Phenylobacterium sp. TaxID=1871053 RepID=UPI0025E9964D|nr:hypothetical protein [Phenylobacterium sp.]MBX3485117.1 PD40 domain-containing protein [Phenylobacterium sp.]
MDKAKEVVWWSSLYTADRGRRIAKTISDGHDSMVNWFADSAFNDYKPIPSPDGSMVAFFRVTNEADKNTGDVSLWRSKICVMNADGSNLRELTGDAEFNGNLHWTRDGTNRITWWRITNLSGLPGDYSWVKIWRTSPDAKPGQEEMLSDPRDPAHFREFGYSHLRDGRLFMRRGSKKYFLMTPNPVGYPKYDQISYADSPMYLHKATISHDETKISYMKQTLELLPKSEYMGSVICVADFDPDNLSIKNEVAITKASYDRIIWYTSFSPDGRSLIYADAGRIMLYDISDGSTRQISTDDAMEHRYPNWDGSVK